MPLGFLGGQVVEAGGFPFLLRRTPMRRDVTEALLDGELVDLRGTLVGGARFVVAMQLAAVRLLVALVSALGAFGGALDVLVRDGSPRGKVLPPALQLLGALGGFASR